MGLLWNLRSIPYRAHFSANLPPTWAPHTNVGWVLSCEISLMHCLVVFPFLFCLNLYTWSFWLCGGSQFYTRQHWQSLVNLHWPMCAQSVWHLYGTITEMRLCRVTRTHVALCWVEYFTVIYSVPFLLLFHLCCFSSLLLWGLCSTLASVPLPASLWRERTQ